MNRIIELERRKPASGATGDTGDTGPVGRSITDATVDRDGYLVLTFSDGAKRTAGRVTGAIGQRGPAGTVTVDVIRDGTLSKSHPDVANGSRVLIRVSDKKE